MPKFHHKVVAVAGDCSVQGLGLSTSDRDLLMRDVSLAQLLSNPGAKRACSSNIKISRLFMNNERFFNEWRKNSLIGMNYWRPSDRLGFL
jgi:hypothetical protein